MRIRQVVGVTVAVVGLVPSLAACGSSDPTTGGAPAKTGDAASAASRFDAAVAKASQPVSAWPGPSAKVLPAKARKIVVVTCSPQGAGCVSAAKGATDAGRSLGWDVKTIAGNGTPQGWNAGILNAISEKADGIVLDAVPPALVGDAVAKAQAAKIPLVSVFNPKVEASGGVFSYVTPDHEAQGVGMADWVASDSKGKAKVILVEDNEFPELAERVKGFKAELAQCGGCSIVATVQSQIGTMAQKLPQAVVSAVQSHPDATYVISQYDSNALFASQGVQQAGKSATVKVGGYEGDPQAVDAIRKGQTQAATIADPTEWMGWQAIDEFARAFAGQPASNVPTQWRLITRGNAPATGVWTGDLDYRAKFQELWNGA
jgi:ribose transport system substrate-binding protein